MSVVLCMIIISYCMVVMYNYFVVISIVLNLICDYSCYYALATIWSSSRLKVGHSRPTDQFTDQSECDPHAEAFYLKYSNICKTLPQTSFLCPWQDPRQDRTDSLYYYIPFNFLFTLRTKFLDAIFISQKSLLVSCQLWFYSEQAPPFTFPRLKVHLLTTWEH